LSETIVATLAYSDVKVEILAPEQYDAG